MITVKVGAEPDSPSFMIHESFVIVRSEFFRRALNGRWAKSDTRTVTLSEYDAETFELYLNYLYKNELPTMTMTMNHGEYSEAEYRATTKSMIREYAVLAKLYVLVEHLQDSPARDAAVRAISQLANIHRLESAEKIRWVAPGEEAINLIYKSTPENSLLRRLVVDLWSDAGPTTLEKYRSF